MKKIVKCVRLGPTALLRVPECYGNPESTRECQICSAGYYCRKGVPQIEKEVER